MDGNGERPQSTAPTTSAAVLEPPVPLVGNHRLLLERRPDADVLRVEGMDGRLRVAVTVTAAGATIELDGADLAIRSSGELSIDAQKLSLRGREEVTIESGGDVEVRAEGALRTEAHEQRHVARRGDHSVYANDDVRLDGERIRMNC